MIPNRATLLVPPTPGPSGLGAAFPRLHDPAAGFLVLPHRRGQRSGWISREVARPRLRHGAVGQWYRMSTSALSHKRLDAHKDNREQPAHLQGLPDRLRPAEVVPFQKLSTSMTPIKFSLCALNNYCDLNRSYLVLYLLLYSAATNVLLAEEEAVSDDDDDDTRFTCVVPTWPTASSSRSTCGSMGP